MNEFVASNYPEVSSEDWKTFARECVSGDAENEVVRALNDDRTGWIRVPIADVVLDSRRVSFDAGCAILTLPELLPVIKKLDFYKIGEQLIVKDAIIIIGSSDIKGMIGIGRSNARLLFGRGCNVNVDIRAWRDARLCIGANATINKARLIVDLSPTTLGDDSMMSDEILLQGGDQHSIWDVATMQIRNENPKPIVVGEHVWIGRRVTVMSGAAIGCGSIVGTGSLVAGDVPPFSLAVGSPARVLRTGTTWSRNIGVFTNREQAFLKRRLA